MLFDGLVMDNLGLAHDLRRPVANHSVYERSIAVDAGEVEGPLSTIPRLWVVELGSGHASRLLGLLLPARAGVARWFPQRVRLFPAGHIE